MLDRFVDAGGTLVDTADTYGRGESERVLAPWLARRRDDVVLATKVRFADRRPARRRARRPTASGRPATRACDVWASTSSTSTRSTRPIRPSRSRRRSRPSTASCGRARCARSAPRTSRRGCSRGRSRRRTATGGRRSCRCRRSTRSSSARSRSRRCRSAAPPASACCRGGRSAPASSPAATARDEAMPEGSRMATAGDDLEEAPARRAIERNFRVVDAARGDRARSAAPPSRRSRSHGCWASTGVAAPIIGPRTMAHLDDLLGAARARPHRRRARAPRGARRRRPTSTRSGCSPSRSGSTS